MSERQRPRAVPLEAGAGPHNPPCPACGEPLFGWLDPGNRLAAPLRRCESCGLAVTGRPGDPEEALAALGSGDEPRFANRASLAAWLGGAGWAGLEPGTRYLFTVEAARRLVARRDQIVAGARWAPGASVAMTWQTVLNGLTFGHDVALGRLGRAQASPAGRAWQRRLDGLISLLAAAPALVIALPLELGAAALRRGAVLTLRLELL